MDSKEIDGIAPTNLDGSTTVVNTVKKPSAEEVQKAAEAEKAKKQDYYVDPLEQDALMQEKLAKIEERKELEKQQNGDTSEDSEGDQISEENIKPDLNVNGFFSAGTTAKKTSFAHRPASEGTLLLGTIVSIIGGVFAVIYFALLISSKFDTNWLLNYIYAVVAVLSVFFIFNGVRSRKAQNKNLQRYALMSIIGSAVSLLPILGWLFYWITSIL